MTTMTRSKGYVLTAVVAALYIFLGIAFADGLFSLDNFWLSEEIFSSSWVSYLLLALIIAGGVMQAHRIPEDGVNIDAGTSTGNGQVEDRRAGAYSLATPIWPWSGCHSASSSARNGWRLASTRFAMMPR
jgi:hypothetical protein